MTSFYYALDIEIDGYIGCGKYNETVTRTIAIEETVITAKGKEIIRDNFTEEFFETNKEQLSSKVITEYNKTHKAKVSRIIGIRRSPIIE